MKNLLIAIIIGFLVFNSCKTDFELNAPYKTIPVVYGLLDQSLDTQFVKINKSFLGNSDNVVSASITDSTQFKSLSAVLEQYNQSNDLTRTDSLKEMLVGSLDPGVFYEDSQKIYYLVTPNGYLDDDYTYRLNVFADSVPEENLNFGGTTDLINGAGLNFKYLSKISLQINGFRCADNDLATLDEYFNTNLEWNTTLNGKRYELVLRLHFTEYFDDGSILPRYVEWDLGDQTSINTDGSESMFKIVSGSSFFEMVNSKLNNYPLEQGVLKRTFGSNAIEFILTAGNDDLNTYMQVNEPVTSVVSTRPIFTNIDNGIGLFASKYSRNLSSFMSNGTVLELCKGQLTGDFKFCCDSSEQVIAISNLTGGINVSCN